MLYAVLVLSHFSSRYIHSCIPGLLPGEQCEFRCKPPSFLGDPTTGTCPMDNTAPCPNCVRVFGTILNFTGGLMSKPRILCVLLWCLCCQAASHSAPNRQSHRKAWESVVSVWMPNDACRMFSSGYVLRLAKIANFGACGFFRQFPGLCLVPPWINSARHRRVQSFWRQLDVRRRLPRHGGAKLWPRSELRDALLGFQGS